MDPDVERFLNRVEDVFAQQAATRNAVRHAVVDLNDTRTHACVRLAKLQAELDGRPQP